MTVAIVTGASRGIGKAVAINFAKLGYDVALIARDEKLLNEVSEHINSTYKVNTSVFAIDVVDLNKVEMVVNKIIAAHGRIDVLFNSAGILDFGTSAIEPTVLQRLIDINIKGVYNFIYAVAPTMKKQRSGYIMNISSQAARAPSAASGGYALTKSAIAGFSHALYDEMMDYNVKVTAIYPCFTHTDMVAGLTNMPDAELIQVNDIVEIVNFLLKLGSSALIKDIDIYCRAFALQSRITYKDEK